MTATRTNRTRLGLEPLESREVLSITYTDLGGGVLQFRGDYTSENLDILDTGGSTSGHISYRTTGPMTAYQTIPGIFTKIDIRTNGGSDTVRYVVSGDLAYGKYRDVTADLGYRGLDLVSNSFTALVRGNINGPVQTLGTTLLSGGSTSLQPKTSTLIAARSGIWVSAIGGTAADTITGRTLGDVLGGSTLSFSFNGGLGLSGSTTPDDTLGVVLTDDVDIAPNATVAVDLSGDHGRDTLFLDYKGELDGKLGFSLDGGDGNDGFSVAVTLDDGSTGYVGGGGLLNLPSTISGGSDDDNIRFDVIRTALSSPTINVGVNGGTGWDTFTLETGTTLRDRETWNGSSESVTWV